MSSPPVSPETFVPSQHAERGSTWWLERLWAGLFVGVACVVGIPLFLLLGYGVPAAAALYWIVQLWPDLLAWLLVPTESPFLYLGICFFGALVTLKPVFFLSQWVVATTLGRLLGGRAPASGPPEESEEAPPLWRRTHQRRVIVVERDATVPEPGTDPAIPGRMVVLEDTVVEEHLAPHCPRCEL